MSQSPKKIRILRAGWVPGEGDVVDDRYRIDEVVASGGMGVVLLAEHLALSRKVAVKVLRPKWSHDEAMARRFRREMNVAKDFSHPHVVQIYDSGQTPDGCLYLVMEWLEGEDLSNLLKREQHLPFGRALRIWKQILDGLAEAHAMGIVHRDLKPANVFVTQDRHGKDHVKLLDFGIARPLEDDEQLTTTGQLCGTIAYMAPEVLLEEGGDQSADVYAASLVFLELLTGQRVVQDTSTVKMMFHHLKSKIPLPQELADTPLGDVLRRSLKKHPQKRYRDADQLLMAVEEATGKMPADIMITPPSRQLSMESPQDSMGGFLKSLEGAGLEFLSLSDSSESLQAKVQIEDHLIPRGKTVALEDDGQSFEDEPTRRRVPSTELTKGRGRTEEDLLRVIEEAKPTQIYDPEADDSAERDRPPTTETAVTTAAVAQASAKAAEPPSLLSDRTAPSKDESSTWQAGVIGALVVLCLVGAGALLYALWDRGEDRASTQGHEASQMIFYDDESTVLHEQVREEPAEVLAEEVATAHVDSEVDSDDGEPVDADVVEEIDEPQPEEPMESEEVPSTSSVRPQPASRADEAETEERSSPQPTRAPEPDRSPADGEPAPDPDEILDRYFQD